MTELESVCWLAKNRCALARRRENFNHDIVRGLRRRVAGIDLLRVQDVGRGGLDDPTILEWAASQNRILLTHDVTTITDHAYQRIEQGEAMPGVFEVPPGAPTGLIISDLILIDDCSRRGEWDGRIAYLPLRPC